MARQIEESEVEKKDEEPQEDIRLTQDGVGSRGTHMSSKVTLAGRSDVSPVVERQQTDGRKRGGGNAVEVDAKRKRVSASGDQERSEGSSGSNKVAHDEAEGKEERKHARREEDQNLAAYCNDETRQQKRKSKLMVCEAFSPPRIAHVAGRCGF